MICPSDEPDEPEQVCVPVEPSNTMCPTYTEEAIYRYNIFVPRSINGYSWTFAEPVATETTATITALSAQDVG